MPLTFLLDDVKPPAARETTTSDLNFDFLRRSGPSSAPLLRCSAPTAKPVLGLAPLLAPPAPAPAPARAPAPAAAPAPNGATSDESAPSPSLLSGAAFGIYALIRFFVERERLRPEQANATAAAGSTSLAFLAAALLVGDTAVDVLAAVSLGTSTIADVSAATRGFEGVPVVFLVDQPVAVCVAASFLFSRRLLSDDTSDLQHQPISKSIRFLVLASYFTIAPAFSFGAPAILTLQVIASALLLVGPAFEGISQQMVALTAALVSAIAREIALSV